MTRISKPSMWFTLVVALSPNGCSFDLFHDTSWLTACDIDPTTPGCGDDASVDADREAGVDGGSDAFDDQ